MSDEIEWYERQLSGRATGAECAVVAMAAAVAVGAVTSLVLAQLAAWSLAPVVGAFLAPIAIGVAVARTHRPAPTERWLVLYLLLLAGLFLGLVLPGNRVSIAGIDPGVYIRHSQHIAESGRLALDDPIVGLGLQEYPDVSADYPALDPSSTTPGELDFAFYHLYPALSAPAYAIGRTLGVSLVSPMVALIGVLSMVLILRRVVGVLSSVVGSAAFAFNYVWVFFADWNGSEVPVATLLLAAMLAGVLSIDSMDRTGVGFALIGGFLLGAGANSRADSFLLVSLVSFVLGAMALAGYRRHVIAAVVGVAPGIGIWATQTYATTADYAAGHLDFGPRVVFGLMIGPVAAGLTLELFTGPVSLDNNVVRAIRQASMVVFGALLVAFLVRSKSAAPGTSVPLDSSTFNPFAIERISWFLGPVAVFLAVAGLVQLARDSSWRIVALVAPGLSLTPVYLWDQRISARLMWAMRRFVPVIWPTLGILVGLGAAMVLVAVSRRYRPALTVVLVVAIVGPQLRWTVPLHDHREWSGGLDVPRQIIGSNGDDTVYMWMRGPSHDAFVVPLLIENEGRNVIGLDPDVSAATLGQIVEDLRRPVVVIADNNGILESLGVPLREAFSVDLRRLEQTYEEVPTGTEGFRFSFAVGQPIS